MSATVETEAISEETAGNGLADRLRDRFALVQTRAAHLEAQARAQVLGLPQQLRTSLTALATRMRDLLDLPTRSELESLIERVEKLDEKLAALEANPSKAKAKANAKAEPTKAKAKTSNGKAKTGNGKAKANGEAKTKKPRSKAKAKSTGDRKSKIKEAASRRKS